ncbi:MAG: hypothetical protein JXQ27_07840 [Acidobacteria bacterium]|nr:hypothetical protein [Acidobacteriota bacterium]
MTVQKGKADNARLSGVLTSLESEGRNGGLTLIKQEEIIILLLREGWIVGLECFPARIDTLLGNMLLLQDMITAEDLLRAREAGAKSGERIWKSLLATQACEESELRETMRHLAGHISFTLLQWEDTRYAFHPEPLPELKNAVLDPLPVSDFLEAGRRYQAEWRSLMEQMPPANALFAPVAEKPVIFRAPMESGLKPKDLYVYERISGKRTMEQLVRRAGIPSLWVAQSMVRLAEEGYIVQMEPSVDSGSERTPEDDAVLDQGFGVHLDPRLDEILQEMLGGDLAETELPLAIKMAFQCGDEDDLPELELAEGVAVSPAMAADQPVPDLAGLIRNFMVTSAFLISACLFSDDGRLLAEVKSVQEEQDNCRRIANLIYSFLRRYPAPDLNRIILDENDRTLIVSRLGRDHFLLVAAAKDVYLGAINIAVNKLAQALIDKMAGSS